MGARPSEDSGHRIHVVSAEAELVRTLLFRFRRRRILRRWARGLDYSSARWQLQRLARD